MARNNKKWKEIINNEYEFNDNAAESKSIFAQCKVIEDGEMKCGVKILYTGSTGNLIKHLARKHTLTKNSSAPSENKGKLKQVKITTMIKSANSGAYFNKVQACYHQEVLNYILEDIQLISYSSRSRHPYIGATATWYDSDFDIKEVLLSIEQFDHPHKNIDDRRRLNSIMLTNKEWSFMKSLLNILQPIEEVI
ncbi:unnamed protein product [Rhizophagus irregularis]|nr:unnamed protein product [Rhizophagus irregularis]